MSDLPQQQPPSDPPVTAAEYVLGLLSPADRAAFTARLRNAPDLQAEVAWWEAHFAALSDEVTPVRPRPALKRALMDDLFGAEQAESGPSRRSFFARAWREIAIAAVSATAVFAFLIVYEPAPPETEPLQAAVIESDDGTLSLAAALTDDGDAISILRTAGQAAPGRVLQLWGIVGDAAPVSLGVLPESAGARVPLPEALRAQVANLVLAVSDEPPGGSPTGSPTGPVLAAGPLTTF